MAQFESTSRTNFFKVTDVEGLKAALADFPLEVELSDIDPTYVCIEPTSGQDSWPTSDEACDEDFSFEDHICPFIAPGAVCIWMEVGAEKSATLSGRTYAYNADGEVAKVDLDDIYDLVAAKLSMAPADIGLISYTDLPASHSSNSPARDTAGG